MTQNEKLLMPRYKVVVKAPGCFKVGTIIEKHKYASGNWYVPNFMYDPEEYPDVFKKLEWFEEQDECDMPKYVRCGDSVHEVKKWVGAFQNTCWVGCHINDDAKFIYSQKLQPAIQAEYEQYINQKQINDTH